MRYLIGFAFVLTSLALPLHVDAQELKIASLSELALIPKHLQERIPGQKEALASQPDADAAAAPAASTPSAAETRKRDPEPYVVDPELSPVGIQRWHPEAFDPAVTSKPELELVYISAEEKARNEERSRMRVRIAVGMVVPAVLIGIGVGIGFGVTQPLRTDDSN